MKTSKDIISGGGWKQEPPATPVKIQAAASSLACLLGAVGSAVTSGLLQWVLIAATLALLILSIFLWWKEEPTEIPDRQDGDQDPRNLYSSRICQ